MLKRFPTWHVWRLLHTYNDPERYEVLTLMLRAKDPVTWLQVIHNLWTWMWASFAISLAINFGGSQVPLLLQNYWILSAIPWGILILINLMCLRFALGVLNVLRRQRITGQYDLLFILPIDEFGHVLHMMRARRYPFDGVVRGKWSGIIIAILLAIMTLSIRLTFNVGFPFSLLQSGTALLGGVYEFIMYVQLFSATAIVTLLVSQYQRSAVSIAIVIGFVIGYFIVSSFISQILGWIAFDYLVFTGGASSFDIYPYLWWATLFQPWIIIACRELINFVLWRMVKRRLEA
jgi:hypothetical protein